MNNILSVCISSGLSFLGVALTVIASYKKTSKKITASNDVMLYRVGELEKKQDKHNDVIYRVFLLEKTQAVQEEEIKQLKETITYINN